MLIDFSVTNFLSIREKQTLSFVADKNITHLSDYYTFEAQGVRLLKIGLLFGANAAGKTNILKALDYFREIVCTKSTLKSETLNYAPFLLDDISRKRNSVFEINFLWNNVHYYYIVEFNDQCIVKEVLKEGGRAGYRIYARQTDIEKQIAIIDFNEKYFDKDERVNTLVANTLLNDTVIGGYLKTNIDNTHLHNVFMWFSSYLVNVLSPKQDLTHYVSRKILEGKIDKYKLLAILKQADLNISDILIKKEEADIPSAVFNKLKELMPPEILKDVQKSGKITSLDINFQHDTPNGFRETIPFELESLGTQRYYGLAGILYQLIKEAHCFLIDELETSLHPDLYLHFILAYCVNSKHSQIIATTHNREILGNEDMFREDIIHIVDRAETGATQLYRLSDIDVSDIAEQQKLILYKAGRLGGVPNLGDYYIEL